MANINLPTAFQCHQHYYEKIEICDNDIFITYVGCNWLSNSWRKCHKVIASIRYIE